MTEPIRLLLNGEPVEVDGLAPQTTLLEWLREHRRLTGTKEGCAEGDCGACTVIVAERDGQALAWRPVNACIRLLPSLDGKAVFTVEGLRHDGTLHPVQQAMVECHGSQCGYCTPGFVMSLFGLYKNGAPATRTEVDDALAGNLCRCTGYRPILAAAQRMRELPAPDGWRAPGRAADGSRRIEAGEEQLVQQLGALERPRDSTTKVRDSDGSRLLPRMRSPRHASTIRMRSSSPARRTSRCGSPSSTVPWAR